MKFETVHITGKGRGKPMGFPTINLKIPELFKLKIGVYHSQTGKQSMIKRHKMQNSSLNKPEKMMSLMASFQ